MRRLSKAEVVDRIATEIRRKMGDEFSQRFEFGGEYLGNLSRVTVTCAVHGCSKSQSWNSAIQGKVICQECITEYRWTRNRGAKRASFIRMATKEVGRLHGPEFAGRNDYGGFVSPSRNGMMVVVCTVHATTTMQSIEGHKLGRLACQSCQQEAVLKRAKRLVSEHNAVVATANTKRTATHGAEYADSVECISQYTPRSEGKGEFRCKWHDLSFWQPWQDFRMGRLGCSKCQDESRCVRAWKHTEVARGNRAHKFLTRVALLHPTLDFSSSQYVSAHDPIDFVCRNCENIQRIPRAARLYDRRGCLQCPDPDPGRWVDKTSLAQMQHALGVTPSPPPPRPRAERRCDGPCRCEGVRCLSALQQRLLDALRAAKGKPVRQSVLADRFGTSLGSVITATANLRREFGQVGTLFGEGVYHDANLGPGQGSRYTAEQKIAAAEVTRKRRNANYAARSAARRAQLTLTLTDE